MPAKREASLTLEDIENIPKEFLLASDVAPFLNSDPATIHYCAKHQPESLGFPVIVMKKTLRIPKRAFINFCKYGPPRVDYDLLAYAVSRVEEGRR